MTRFCIICATVLCASYCSPEAPETSSEEQFGSNIQDTELQGTQLQGSNIQGMTMQGFGFAGATLNGAALTNVHVDKGELVADQNQVTLHGASLAGAHLSAQVRNVSVNPPTTASVEYRITSVAVETGNDPTNTGSTFLYTLEQNVDNLGSWQPACPLDLDGRRVAIPLAATWDETGARVESTTMFTFGCTSGVIAKCYRWGYRPWVTGYGDLAEMHWICTRLARADYCGDGTSHTQDGTLINIWDTLPSPGPIQHWEALPGELLPGLFFEAGWRTNGAACLSHARWLLPDGALIALECPGKLILPGLAGLGGTACDTLGQALGYGSAVKMFDESYLLH